MVPKITAIVVSDDRYSITQVLKNPLLYVYEPKVDGWRCLAKISGKSVTLQTKSGKTHAGFAQVRKELVGLGFEEAVFDGELACLDSEGNPDFEAVTTGNPHVIYFVFDLLWLNGEDVRQLSLLMRKQILQRIFPQTTTGTLRRLPYYESQEAQKLLARTRKHTLEGLVAKLKDAGYDPTLPANWVKILNADYNPIKKERAKRFAGFRKPQGKP